MCRVLLSSTGNTCTAPDGPSHWLFFSFLGKEERTKGVRVRVRKCNTWPQQETCSSSSSSPPRHAGGSSPVFLSLAFSITNASLPLSTASLSLSLSRFSTRRSTSTIISSYRTFILTGTRRVSLRSSLSHVGRWKRKGRGSGQRMRVLQQYGREKSARQAACGQNVQHREVQEKCARGKEKKKNAREKERREKERERHRRWLPIAHVKAHRLPVSSVSGSARARRQTRQLRGGPEAAVAGRWRLSALLLPRSCSPCLTVPRAVVIHCTRQRGEKTPFFLPWLRSSDVRHTISSAISVSPSLSSPRKRRTGAVS